MNFNIFMNIWVFCVIFTNKRIFIIHQCSMNFNIFMNIWASCVIYTNTMIFIIHQCSMNFNIWVNTWVSCVIYTNIRISIIQNNMMPMRIFVIFEVFIHQYFFYVLICYTIPYSFGIFFRKVFIRKNESCINLVLLILLHSRNQFFDMFLWNMFLSHHC